MVKASLPCGGNSVSGWPGWKVVCGLRADPLACNDASSAYTCACCTTSGLSASFASWGKTPPVITIASRVIARPVSKSSETTVTQTYERVIRAWSPTLPQTRNLLYAPAVGVSGAVSHMALLLLSMSVQPCFRASEGIGAFYHRGQGCTLG